jgi:8-oxo-dGTP diphosphatase
MAVAIVIADGELVVMRRKRDGSTYYTLPGGGIEPGETAAEACVRELYEETGLRGRVVRRALTLDNQGRQEHYFEVAAERFRLRLGDPETTRMSSSNLYAPMWLPLEQLARVDLRPDAVRLFDQRGRV